MTNDKVEGTASDIRPAAARTGGVDRMPFSHEMTMLEMKVIQAGMTIMVESKRMASPIRMALDLWVDVTGWKTAYFDRAPSPGPASANVGVECKSVSMSTDLQTDAPLDAYQGLCTTEAMFKSVAVIGCGGIGSSLANALGKAMTMRVILEAEDAETAGKVEESLCVDLQAIVSAGCDIREALDAIHYVLPETDLSGNGRIRVHSASVCEGWSARISDPSAYLSGAVEERGAPVAGHVALADLSDFCMSRFLDAWYGREDKGWIPAVALPILDATESPDFEDDFFRADRVLGLWYGGSKRARR